MDMSASLSNESKSFFFFVKTRLMSTPQRGLVFGFDSKNLPRGEGEWFGWGEGK